MAFPAYNDYKERKIVGKYMKIDGTDYSQIRIIFNPIKKAIQIDPKNSIDFNRAYQRANGSTDWQFGFEYSSEAIDFLRILIENDTDNHSKRELLKKYLFGDKQYNNLSDYEEIEKKVFGDLKVNEETDIVIDEDRYQNSEGDFLVQNNIIGTGEDCECKCSSKKYTKSNPDKWNYLFNPFVFYPPLSSKKIAQPPQI